MGDAKNVFGNPHKESKRNLTDYFIIKPFSVLNTQDAAWLRRKSWWVNLIQERGKSREGVLYKDNNAEEGIAKDIQNFNNGVSLFDPVLSEAMVTWFSNTGMTVLDPFAGDESRGFVSTYLGRKYVGIELRKEQADLNRARIVEAGFGDSVEYHADTCENLNQYVEKESMDLMFACPPYLWLEKYSDDPNDLSNMTKEKFFEVLQKTMDEVYAALKPNRFAVMVIGEVRDKDGSYVGFVPEMCNIMKRSGFHYYNELILQTNVGTLRFRVGNSMKNRKVGKNHQNILVFYKGDIGSISETFKALI